MTQTQQSATDFLMGGGVPSAKFENVGASVTGRIVTEPVVSQQTDFTTGEPKFWADGSPRQQLKVVLDTEQRDASIPDDDGTRAIYVKGNMTKAVRDAVKAAGAKGLAVGGTLTVTYTGDDAPKQRGLNGAKLYSATYAAPAATGGSEAFLGDQPARNPGLEAAMAALTPQQRQALLANAGAGNGQPPF